MQNQVSVKILFDKIQLISLIIIVFLKIFLKRAVIKSVKKLYTQKQKKLIAL